MTLLQNTAVIMATTVILSGCVSTSTVSASQVNDQDLTCDSIATRIGEVDAARSFAKSKRGVSSENVAAALFFWPALIANNSNTTRMINSMDARSETLNGLYQGKNCSSEVPSYTSREIQKKIKASDTLESFSNQKQ